MSVKSVSYKNEEEKSLNPKLEVQFDKQEVAPNDQVKPDKQIVLKGNEAIKLWLKGKEKWNQWVVEHPEADVDFSGVDFSRYRKESPVISFEGFRFPKGLVNFSKALFGEGDVYFSGAQFGEGDVDFSGALFGEGDVYFRGAQFGEGDVNFSEAQFGEGDVIFSEVQFGEGNVDFGGAQFGEGDVHFRGAQFGEGDVDFSYAQFGEGDVHFRDAQFGEGDVEFSYAQFGEGLVNFGEAQFGEGALYFFEAQFGKGDVTFANAKFSSNVYFSNLQQLSEIKLFSLTGASFSGVLDITNNEFHCIVDLTKTSFKNQVDLSGLQCELSRERFGRLLYLKKAEYPEDAAKLRRLKEIAEGNHHHQKALAFHADENRAMRWQSKDVFLKSIIDTIFSALCNYGQSILRPSMWFLASIVLFGVIYGSQSDHFDETKPKDWSAIVTFSSLNSIPILPVSRKARQDGMEAFFPTPTTKNHDLELKAEIYKDKWLLNLTMGLQGLISVILLFLIGLGLRNRFRI